MRNKCERLCVEAVRNFFLETVGEGQDDEICQYVAGALVENDSLEVEELRDLVAGFAPGFEALPNTEQQVALLRLLEQAKPAKPEEQGSAASPAAAAAAAALAGLPKPGSAGGSRPAATGTSPAVAPARATAAAAAQLGALSLTQPQGEKDGKEARPTTAASPSAATQAAKEAVSLLEGLCPVLPHAFLAHVLAARCGGRVEAAAAYLLDSHDISGEYAAWEAEEAKRALEREQAEREKELNRAKILQKFQLEAVAEGSGRKPQQINAWSAKDTSNSKVRYRDGMTVSTKGEKFIIEKVGEDWDGGSRGKVFTKGKRGKGFL